MDGRFVINERAEQASIANGTQGKWRKRPYSYAESRRFNGRWNYRAINHSRHASRNTGRGKKTPHIRQATSQRQYRFQVPIARVI